MAQSHIFIFSFLRFALLIATDSDIESDIITEDITLSPVCFVENWKVPERTNMEPPMTHHAIEVLVDKYNEGSVSYHEGLNALSRALYNIGVVCTRRQSQCLKGEYFQTPYEHRKVSPASNCELETYSWHEG
jgi:hypothetical protein